MGSLKTQNEQRELSDVCSSKTRYEDGILSASKPGKTSITIQMTNIQSLDIHCPVAVLDLPAPDDDVDVVGKLVGDLGDVLKPLDVLEEGEELLPDGRIEREQTSFSL